MAKNNNVLTTKNLVAVFIPREPALPAVSAETWILYDNASGDSQYPYTSVVQLYADERHYEIIEQFRGTFGSLGDALTHTANIVNARHLPDATIHINSGSKFSK